MQRISFFNILMIIFIGIVFVVCCSLITFEFNMKNIKVFVIMLKLCILLFQVLKLSLLEYHQHIPIPLASNHHAAPEEEDDFWS